MTGSDEKISDMRADRLVAILLMLQQRGQVTANDVAVELEISERTARRDLDALGMAGLPVYSQQGRGGGYRLAGGGRTDLSGLTSAEARALFLVAGPSSSTTPELRAALRKLVRALPEQFRAAATHAASSVVVDRSGWDVGSDPAPARTAPDHLEEVQRAVIESLQVRLGYRSRSDETTSRAVDPLGLVAKGPNWYLVAQTAAGQRTFRVDRITSIEPTGAVAVRPADFDLSVAWQSITDEVDRMRNPMRARALVDPATVRLLRFVLGNRLQIGAAAPDGRIEVEIRAHGVKQIAGELAGFGAAIEVLDPPEVRDELRTIACELSELYAEASPDLADASPRSRSNQRSHPKAPSA
jgi:predicted DNA-binding transcriptional regulator YafY